MTRERLLPGDSVRFIEDCLRRGRVLWTYHVNMRLAGRYIPRESILEAAETLELVEAYPDDKYLPSYLVLARAGLMRSNCLSRWTWKAIVSALSRPIARAPANGKTT